MTIDHWMTFGSFAEQRHFIYPSKDEYKGVIINANMVAHAPDGMAAFLLEKTQSMTYLIDPITHAYQHNPSAVTDKAGKVKSAIRKLSNQYGLPVSDIVGKKSLTAKYLQSNKKEWREWIRRCLEFQRNMLVDAMKESDVIKYLEESKDIKGPHALIAPYFYMTESSIDSWLPVNSSCIKYAIEMKASNEKIFAELVINKGILLDNEMVDQIQTELGSLDVDGIIVWVDELNEAEANVAELKGLVSLCKGLSRKNREIINLHGGYFSILAGGDLGGNALSGIAHGPEFGEHRAVVPVGGGIPIAKYYIPALHSRMKYKEAVYIFNKKKFLHSAKTFFDNVCDCEKCKSIIQDDPENFIRFGDSTIKSFTRNGAIVNIDYPTTTTKQNCLQHYLWRKKIEYDFVQKASRPKIIDELHRCIEAYDEDFGDEITGHLKNWLAAFGEPYAT